MPKGFQIRRFQPDDRAQWRTLWRGYLDFYEAAVEEAATELVWRRLLDPAGPIRGFCADEDGRLLGLTHYLFHPVTWSAGPRCYLEDLFTAKEARGRGVGEALIRAVYADADAHEADQVYWLTARDNARAQRLYDRVARQTRFVKYMR